jgi:hypothetical protein
VRERQRGRDKGYKNRRAKKNSTEPRHSKSP